MMKGSTKIVVTIAIIVIAGFFFLRGGNAEPGKYDEFAQCLTENGAQMYGAYWCPHCANQKKMFGKSWDHVNYIECDPRGNNAQPELCDAAGIAGFPTWIFSDGSRTSGETALQELSLKTGCELP